MTEPIVDTTDLSKRYGSVHALRDVSLSVEDNDVYGLLGPNGAGKSTLINVLLNFVTPTSGQARVGGVDCQDNPIEVHRRVGVLPDRFGVFRKLSGRRHVQYVLDSRHQDGDPVEILERVGLADAANERAEDYSSGMEQRLGLAMALAGSPSVLILDEPFSGLDPTGARLLRDIVREERRSGTTILLSSHLLDHVERVCTRIGLLSDGRLLAEGPIDELLQATEGGERMQVRLRQAPTDMDPLREALREVPAVDDVTVGADRIVVEADGSLETERLVETVQRVGADVRDVETGTRSLEDLFVAYTEDDR